MAATEAMPSMARSVNTVIPFKEEWRISSSDGGAVARVRLLYCDR